MEQPIKKSLLNRIDSGWQWVPSLYFIEGLPYIFVMSVSVIFFKRMNLSNSEIAFYTSWLYLPWIIKPFWSPIVDLVGSKRRWILIMQFIIGALFAGIALSLPFENWLNYTLLFFWLIAFSSATHDISADGFYMLALPPKKQAKFVGIRSTFYRIAMITGQGLFVILAGELEQQYGSVKSAWSITFGITALIFFVFAIYHKFILTKSEEKNVNRTHENILNSFLEVFIDFFRKKQITTIILFLLLYRLSEAQLVKLASPFLLDASSAGGLGLTTAEIGFIYGTIGIIFLVLGGILGGLAIAKEGLKYWLLPMVIAINVPNAVYWLFAIFHPHSLPVISIGVAFEQFGYGFGFAAYLVYAMMISEGKYRTAHYAIATGFMALGMMLPGMISGYLQEALGYSNFFLWVLISAIPIFILIKFVNITPEYGKKSQG